MPKKSFQILKDCKPIKIVPEVKLTRKWEISVIFMYFDAKDILLKSRIKEKIKESLNGPISV